MSIRKPLGRHTRNEPADAAQLLERWAETRKDARDHFTMQSAMAEHERTREAPLPAIEATFRPPRGLRRWLGLFLVVSVVLAVLAVLRAIELRTNYDLGIAIFFCGLSMLLWWGLAGSTSSRIRLTSGVLEIQQGRDLKRFDLRDPAQRVHMHGRPSSKDWRISLEQPPKAPFVIDRRMVDPVEFSAAVERYRGQLYRR